MPGLQNQTRPTGRACAAYTADWQPAYTVGRVLLHGPAAICR